MAEVKEETHFPQLAQKQAEQLGMNLPDAAKEPLGTKSAAAGDPLLDPADDPSKKVIVHPDGKISLEDAPDDEFLKALNKRTGKNYKSFEEFKEPPAQPTAKELEAQAEAEKAESLSWAIDAKKIKKDDYDAALIAKSKNPRDIALTLFAAECKEADTKVTDEEIGAMFADYYGENEEEGSWKRNKGVTEINKVATQYLSQYKEVDSIVDQYREFKTLKGQQKAYDKQIRQAVNELPKELSFSIPYNANGTETTLEYKVPVDEKIATALIKEFANDNMFYGLGANKGEIKPEALKGMLEYDLKARMYDAVIPNLLAQHAQKVEELIMVFAKNARNPNQPIAGMQTIIKTERKQDFSRLAELQEKSGQKF